MKTISDKTIRRLAPPFIGSFFLHGTSLFIFCSIYVLWLMILDNDFTVSKQLNILPFLIIWVLGILSELVNYHDVLFHEIYRYTFYVFTPIISLILGYVIARKSDADSIYKALFFFGFAVCLKYVYEIIVSLPKYGLSLDLFRSNKYNLTSLAVISLLVYMINRIDRKMIFSKRIDLFFAIVCFISIITSMSRYLIISFIIGISIILFFNRKKSIAFVYALRIIALFLLVFGFLYVYPTTRTVLVAAIDKFMSSSSELSLDVPTWGEQEVNNSWRGYEMSCALRQFSNASIFSQIFGTGLKGVDVGSFASLVTDSSSTYLPLLHNGYLGILSYSGIVGLLAYIVFIIKNIKLSLKRLEIINSISILRFCLIAIIMISTYIVTGPISSTGISFEMLIIGMLVSSRQYD